MSQDHFQIACDRISKVVDEVQYERLRWARNEGPMLAHLVALALSAFEERPEFELIEEGGNSSLKRFALKIHGHRVIAIAIWLDQGRGVINAERLERSRYSIAEGGPFAADFTQIDAAWITSALQQLFARVESQPSNG